MNLNFINILILIVVLFLFVLLFILSFILIKFSQKNKKLTANLLLKESQTRREVYEIAILKELGDMMGYSLNIQKILDTILNSLHQLIEYNSVSYMILEQDNIVFKFQSKISVSQNFIERIKQKMIDSFSLISERNLNKLVLRDISRNIQIFENLKENIGSFLNIPVIVCDKTEAILTISHFQENFYKEEEVDILFKIIKQASVALEKLREVVEQETSKMNAMVSSMTDGVIMVDNDFKIVVANPSILKLFDFNKKDVFSILDITERLENKIDIKLRIKQSIDLGQVFLSEEISIKNNFFRIIVSPVKNNEITLGSVIVFQDITKDKEIAKIKEEFTSMIVHELRSPLDGIKKIVEFIRNSKVKKQKQLECFQMIYKNSSDMLQLVNNLLDMSKIEAGKFDILKQESDIKEVINSRILFYQASAKDKDIILKTQFSNNIPLKVNFDSRAISQVLNNFISNALKFNKEKGSINIQVFLHKKENSILKEAQDIGIDWFITKEIENINDSLFIAVTNTGKGIPQDQINKLFNKFFQVKSNYAKEQGTGLGLAVVKSIIESHDGVVGAQSVLGEGATFYFTLPL